MICSVGLTFTKALLVFQHAGCPCLTIPSAGSQCRDGLRGGQGARRRGFAGLFEALAFPLREMEKHHSVCHGLTRIYEARAGCCVETRPRGQE